MCLDFVIRTCSTLMNSLTTPTNLSIINPTPGECHIDVYTDQLNSVTVPAYYCYCNDKTGCNQAAKTSRNSFMVYSLFLVSIYIYRADFVC